MFRGWCSNIDKINIKEQRGDDGRLVLNVLQHEMVERVPDQVRVDIRARNTTTYDNFNPLRWSMHGGLGTGNSHVINIIKNELFEQILKYTTAEYVVSCGFTSRHGGFARRWYNPSCFELASYRKTMKSNELRKQQEIAKQLLQCRLITDRWKLYGQCIIACGYRL